MDSTRFLPFFSEFKIFTFSSGNPNGVKEKTVALLNARTHLEGHISI